MPLRPAAWTRTLDPGSAQCAVRDDVKRTGRAVRDDFAFLLSSPRKRGSSGPCDAPISIPARRCAPSGMTSKAGAHDPAWLRFFAVIPAQAGIQWPLRCVRLDPGSALCAVRDDVKSKGARSGVASLFCCHPRGCGDPVRLAARTLDPGSALRAVRDDIERWGTPFGMTSREVARREARRFAFWCHPGAAAGGTRDPVTWL